MILTTEQVEAYTASWIEMSQKNAGSSIRQSRLIQPRGLKLDSGNKICAGTTSRLIQPRGLK